MAETRTEGGWVLFKAVKVLGRTIMLHNAQEKWTLVEWAKAPSITVGGSL